MKRPRIYLVALVVSLVLFILASMLRFIIQAGRITDIWSVGFPLAYYETWGPCPAPGTCQAFYPLSFALDLVFWVVLGLGAALLVRRLARG